MDELARYNQERWEELAGANVLYSRPLLDLNQQSAHEQLDPYGVMGEIKGKDVLCLASGGGQQSVAAALLGANVTVVDLSPTQLQRDREAALHYNLQVNTSLGDMRDLSHFGEAAFDLVWHAYSINFVPDARVVFREVARVLRPGGLYRMMCSNPFVAGLDEEDWNGSGYPLSRPYVDGAELAFEFWNVDGGDGVARPIKAPREFRHTLSTVVNGLVEQGFVLLGVWEELADDPEAVPGSWEHLKSIAPPWLTFWARSGPPIGHTHR